MTRLHLIGLAGLVCVLSPSMGNAGDLRWRMNSLLHPHLFGESARVFAAEVGRASEGRMAIEVQDQMVLDVDAFEALRLGLVDAVWGSPGHHHREDPSLTLFGGFPFGPDPEAFTAWMTEGGGAATLNGIYAQHGLHSIYCGILPAETGGWFQSPVESVADLEGLSMRAFGYAAATLRGLGVTTYELPAADIRPAFETGVIGAAEFAMPSIDALLGFPEFAAHLYVPGWQQPATSLELLIPERTWMGLSESDRDVIASGCEASLRWSREVAAPRQEEALEAFRARGVVIAPWPKPVLDALRLSWEQVVAAEVAEDPDAAAAWQSYLDFARQRDAEAPRADRK